MDIDNIETEIWITAAGKFEVVAEKETIKPIDLQEHNFDREDEDRIWIATSTVSDYRFGHDSNLVTLRSVSKDFEGETVEVTHTINRNHIYSIRSTYVANN